MAKNSTVKMIDAHQLSCTCAAPSPTKQNPHKALAREATLLATVTQKMAWRSAGSLSRSLVSTARVSSLRSAPPLRRLRPPTVSTPRRLAFASPRSPFRLSFEKKRLFFTYMLFADWLLRKWRKLNHALLSDDIC